MADLKPLLSRRDIPPDVEGLARFEVAVDVKVKGRD
jgi:hypothetical protein